MEMSIAGFDHVPHSISGGSLYEKKTSATRKTDFGILNAAAIGMPNDAIKMQNLNHTMAYAPILVAARSSFDESVTIRSCWGSINCPGLAYSNVTVVTPR